MDHIPGIDMPEEKHKRARVETGHDQLAKEVAEQNADFDEEVNRLFGDAMESDGDDGEAGQEYSEAHSGSSDDIAEAGSEKEAAPSESDVGNDSVEDTHVLEEKEDGDTVKQGYDNAFSTATPEREIDHIHDQPPPAVLDHLR